jgi:hypothetical protein
MVVEEHARAARTFLEAADQEFAAGDVLQGSEKLWGAAAHAVMAIAQERGWRFNSHGALKDAARRLSEEYADLSIRDRFAVAEKFHGNFYHQWMPDIQVEQDRPIVREFVDQVLSLDGLA